MTNGQRGGVVLAVLAAGGTAGLLFRKDAPTVPPGELTTPHAAAAGPYPEAGFRDSVQRRLSAGPVTSEAWNHTQPHRLPTASAGEEPQAAADLSPIFRRSASPVGSIHRPLEAGDDRPRESADHGDGPRLPPATHTIVDGDTLTHLAERYLGSADRYLEIYELNSDVLSSPDLLPIGKQLNLPLREKPRETSAHLLLPTIASPSSDGSANANEEELPLVPVAPALPSAPTPIPTLNSG